MIEDEKNLKTIQQNHCQMNNTRILKNKEKGMVML